MLACLWLAVCVVSVSCHRQHTALLDPALFVGYSKIIKTEIGYKSYRWELSVDVIRGRQKIRPKDWVLLSWHWSENFLSNERFCHPQLGAHFPYFGFSGETLTKHLLPYLPCSSNNQFENNIKRALGPSGLVWSSNSLYLWNNEGYCGP